jgi:anti-sigma factor RsiW
MNCHDAIELVGEFLEMTLDAKRLAELEAHLADCQPCQAYLRTYRRTRDIAAAAQRAEAAAPMPAEMKAHLRAFLLAQLLTKES